MRAGLDDAARRADLRRMKAFATGLLVLAAAVYVVTRRAESVGAPSWVGYLNAAAEAGMVGGLADWFAVTALFRRPLGLPIPHTALIPTRKEALGESLSEFVAENFLAPDVVQDKVARADIVGRVGRWVTQPAHANRVTAELAALVRGGLAVLRDEDVKEVVAGTLLKRLESVEPGPPLGRLLAATVADGGHKPAVDLLVVNIHEWLLANRWVVIGQVAAQAPPWAPRLVNEAVSARVYSELCRVAGEVRRDPGHPWRDTADAYLLRLAEDLQRDTETMQRTRALLDHALAQPEIRTAIGDVAAAARRLLVAMVDEPDGELRRKVAEAVGDLGQRLAADPVLHEKVTGWVQQVATYVASGYRREITGIITDTVQRWDGQETARRIELQVGRDLQFIRVNGFAVGALAGVLIHAVSRLI